MVLEKRVESRLAEKNIDPDFHVKVKVNKKKQKQKEKWRGIMVYFKLSSFLSTLLQRGGGDKHFFIYDLHITYYFLHCKVDYFSAPTKKPPLSISPFASE